MAIAKGQGLGLACQPSIDYPRGVPAALLGRIAHAWHWLAVIHADAGRVAHHKDFGMPRHRQIWCHPHSTGPVRLDP